jgi:hypothetical protein
MSEQTTLQTWFERFVRVPMDVAHMLVKETPPERIGAVLELRT